MRSITLALRYIWRKRGRTISLLLILLVVATTTLTGLAVRGAAADAQQAIRQALGGVFTIEQDESNPENWTNRQAEAVIATDRESAQRELYEAIEGGDLERAKSLCEAMKWESQFMHDLLVDGVAGLISFVKERLGDDGVKQAWEYSLERSWRKPVEMIARSDRRAIAEAASSIPV